MTRGRIAIAAGLSLSVFAAAGSAEPLSCRHVEIIDAETGAPVTGIEDIAVDRRRGVAYLSAYDRLAVERSIRRNADEIPEGAIYRLEAAQLASQPRAENMRVAPVADRKRLGTEFRPHGVALRADSAALAVINRTYVRADGEWRITPEVAVIPLLGEEKARSFAAHCRANDVAFLGDALLITRDREACGASAWAENVFGLRRGAVAMLDRSGAASVLIAARRFPNGVVAAREQGFFAVALTREQAIEVFEISQEAPLSGRSAADREPLKRIKLPGAPDNISIGPKYDLLAAVAPSLMRLALYRRGWTNRAPSRIVALDRETGATRVLFDDPRGEILSGATIAVEFAGAVIAGSAVDDGLAVCRGAP
ncbi:MAG: hypothetical protein Tsb0010_03170 [Parvularculaceae bacterium]